METDIETLLDPNDIATVSFVDGDLSKILKVGPSV